MRQVLEDLTRQQPRINGKDVPRCVAHRSFKLRPLTRTASDTRFRSFSRNMADDGVQYAGKQTKNSPQLENSSQPALEVVPDGLLGYVV